MPVCRPTKTFFVVEDHTLTNHGIREFLSEQNGFECAGFAFSKSEYMKKFAALSESECLPDIVILDLSLQEESGIDILREIKKRYPAVKVLVYSMYRKPSIVSLALEIGAEGFVQKSAPESEFFYALKTILNGETYVQSNLISPLFTYRTIFDGLTRQEQVIFKMLIERKTDRQITKELTSSAARLKTTSRGVSQRPAARTSRN